MKKINYVLFVFAFTTSLLYAAPVKPNRAKQVAQNFYKQNSKIEIASLSLAYTGLTPSGTPAYYVYNINNNDGFVIVSADDIASPIIGYSTQNNFVVPEASATIGHWLTIRAKEIANIQSLSLLPTAEVALTWMKYESNNSFIMNKRTSSVASTMSTSQPLVQSTWNQSPYYNALCPGGSVTGCVATAMAQIMRYWSYPAKGTGSSSYCDCTTQGFTNNYGTLSANYAATTYNWANMPLNVTTHNTDVATLNYQCGVSVDMDYDPSGSGAWVITADDPICAQNSYVTYFGYDPTTIQGLNRSDYDDSTWTNLLKNDINIGRPIQYVGDDPTEGGHTWVCDGYDQNDFFHMNWGWGGFDNGYFLLNNLQTTNGTFNPSVGHQAVIGIVPIATNAIDASIPAIMEPVGSNCAANFSPSLKLQNFGSSTLTSCNVYYKIDNGTPQLQSWNGSLVTGQATVINLPNFTATAGSHTLTCYSSNPNASIDANPANDQSTVTFNVIMPGNLPIVEGFESNALPGTMWNISHTSTGADWAVTGNAAATGSKSCMIDNSNNTAGNNSILQTALSYDMTTYTSPALSFKVAYQKKASGNNDKLQVFVSTDCGNSWVSKWARWSSTLDVLSGTGTGVFTPTSAEFTTYTVNISSLSGSTNVLFRWEFFADPNGPGNNIYLDDINITNVATAAAGIEHIETNTGLNLYPNPSGGRTNITFNLTEKQSVAIQVTDMLGRTVETIDSKMYQAGETTLIIGADKAYEPGVYLVNINMDEQHISKKLLVQ
jgi:hypothetical protein